ncbi:hypothetical protein HMPREF3221_02259 [Fusobacterium nucleatum]|uniref:Uncharacterized protein n=1 Tax=Fusobacterium nucleatum TaxID=851 RepID=A0A133NEM5_FUSNU|nr:hypothetical protein HMPREF3221_02259 [Fusobacterium nucleatum]
MKNFTIIVLEFVILHIMIMKIVIQLIIIIMIIIIMGDVEAVVIQIVDGNNRKKKE